MRFQPYRVSKNRKIKRIFCISLIFVNLMFFYLYFFHRSFFTLFNSNNNQNTSQNADYNDKPVKTSQDLDITPTVVTLDKENCNSYAKDDNRFSSITVEFEDEDICVVRGVFNKEKFVTGYPKQTSDIKGAVVYVHGQYEEIKESEDKYYNKLLAWAKLYASSGYAFVAGDLAGEEYRSLAVGRVDTWVDFMSLKYNTKPSLLAFSLGGVPATLYIKEHPDKLRSVIMLAPNTNVNFGVNDCKDIADLPILVWYGDKDVNVPESYIKRLYNQCYKYTKELRYFKVLGLDHWKLGYIQDPLILFSGL